MGVSEAAGGGRMCGGANEGAENSHSGLWIAGLVLCSPGREVIYESCTGHTSPSWLALLTPCHILVGWRNSLFLFELIRTKKKKVSKRKKEREKKGFLTETLGKAKGVECGRGAAELCFPKQSGFCFCLVLSHREVLPVRVLAGA